MEVLITPIRALSSLEFYRRVLKKPFWHCLAYLAYLSLIASLVVLIAFATRVLPVMDQFTGWFRANMPVIVWTPEGISMNQPSPYVMTHPELGPVITFDMTQTEVTRETMGKVKIFVTAQKAYVRQSAAELRVYDFTARAGDPGKGAVSLKREGLPSRFNLDQQTVGDWYVKAKPWMMVLAAAFYFPFFFIWKMLIALFYSLMGNIFNMARTPRLDYGPVFKVSVYAMTASIVMEWIQMLVPVLDRIPLGLMGGLIITSGYLFLAIKKTEPEHA